MKPDDLKELQEDVEEIAERLSASQKIRNVLFTVAAVMIGFGQWNDTKDLVIALYETSVSSFTNNVEYAALDELSVGITRDYLESVVGAPKVIKVSEIDPAVQYEYLFNEKYLLTTFMNADRLVGYSVIALKEGFAPHLPFSETADNLNGEDINVSAITQMGLIYPQSYINDYRNILFYIENRELDITGLFLQRSVGYVNYSLEDVTRISELIMSLQDAEMFEDDPTDIVNNIRAELTPNFYAVGDISPQLFADALLTKYEYHKFK